MIRTSLNLLLTIMSFGATMSQASQNHELIVCGWDEVFILDTSNLGATSKIWSWRAAGRTDLPEEYHSLFDTTDECKPFDDGQKLLITSSGGAVAYLDREVDRVLFYGRAANAHSGDLLPGGRIAVAASHALDGSDAGDRLIVFDLDQPEVELWSEELPWGHGAVWDEHRQLLWALSGHDIRVFELRDWDSDAPKLHKVASIRLPERGGHDMYPVPGTSYLGISTARHAWLFDRDTREMLLHPELGETLHVKSMSQHPSTGTIVYIKGEDGHWWSENLYFSEPPDTLHVTGEHFYKARWNVRIP